MSHVHAQCPTCGRHKKMGQAYKYVYECRKCHQIGCISRDITMARIEEESCWPNSLECPEGGTHIRVRLEPLFNSVYA